MALGRFRSVPAVLTRTIGREREIDHLETLLRRETVRLVTLTGPGGVGKTRLAIQVTQGLALGFPDGIVFVPLAPVVDTARAAPTIAECLGLREAGEDADVADLIAYLRLRATLIILDNFEHMLAATPVVLQILAECPSVKILITSRSALRVTSEREIPVGPLPLPAEDGSDSVMALEASPSVALFVERAQGVSPAFALSAENATTVVEICRRLDGLPLAIELAAPWVRMLSTSVLLGRLDDRLKLLASGARDAPDRQRTLRETLAWSYRLLTEAEKAIFRRSAVFAGSWSLHAAEAVCEGWADGTAEGDVLQDMGSLIDHSLVYPVEGVRDEPRFAMLGTVREFALDRLEAAGETGAVQAKLAAWGIRFVEEARVAVYGPDQGLWFERLKAERATLRIGANGAIGIGDAVSALRLAGALGRFWWVRGHRIEDKEWLQRALAQDLAAPDERKASPRVRASALLVLGNFSFERGDLAAAAAVYAQSIAVARGASEHWNLGLALLNLGMVTVQQGEWENARATLEEGMRTLREAGRLNGAAMVLTILGGVVTMEGDPAAAAAMLDEALTIHFEHGDTRMVAFTFNAQGEVARALGAADDARRLFEQSLSLSREIGERRGAATATTSLGWLALDEHDLAAARRSFERALMLRTEIGDRLGLAECATGFAAAIVAEHPAVAARLLGATAAIRDQIGSRPVPAVAEVIAHTASVARQALGSEAFRRMTDEGMGATSAEAILAEVEALIVPIDPADVVVVGPVSASAPVPVLAPILSLPIAASGNGRGPGATMRPAPLRPKLSRREREVLAMIVTGHQDREIADLLFVTSRTVSWHVTNILNKLGVNSRVAAAVIAIREGLVDATQASA